jgi:nucleoside 2-deoxyribosyltransferase
MLTETDRIPMQASRDTKRQTEKDASTTRSKKLRCFVAMAFDKADTDEIYESAIEPEIRDMQATCLRVDQVEHNQGIDTFIIEKLKQADFCVVDLTYARPSVYYEAGYAERAIPVTYTCRQDHIGANVVDPYRVHFDLQMKNIVKWSASDITGFRKRLRKRLAYVTRPLKAQLDEDQAFMEARRYFRQLSVLEQVSELRICFENEARRTRLHTADMSFLRLISQNPIVPLETLHSFRQTFPDWIGTIKLGSTLHSVTAFMGERFTQERLKAIRNAQICTSIVFTPPNSSNADVTTLIDHYVMCSASRLQTSTISRLWSDYRKDLGGKTLSYGFRRQVPIVKSCPGQIRGCYLAFPIVIGLGREHAAVFELLNGSKIQWAEQEGDGTKQRIDGKTVDWQIQMHLVDGVCSSPEAMLKFRGILDTVVSK